MSIIEPDLSRTEPVAADEHRLKALLDACDAARRSGDAELGARQADAALALAQQLGSPKGQARALALKGMHEFRLGRNERSLMTLSQALTLFEGLGDEAGVSSVLGRMVLAYHNLGLTEEALEASERNVASAKRSCDPFALSTAYMCVGTANNAAGDHASAIAATQLALEIAREVGDADTIFIALNNMADDFVGLSRQQREARDPACEQTLVRAIEVGREALAVARSDNSVYQEALALINLGDALGYAGQITEAVELLTLAQQLAEGNGFGAVAVSAREARAELTHDSGDPHDAIRLLQALLADVEATNETQVQLNLLLSLCRAHKQLGQYREALEYHERYSAVDHSLRSALVETRSRLLSNRVEFDRMHRAAEQASLDSQVQRARAGEREQHNAALQQRTEMLRRRADEDGLTGLWNRRRIQHVLPQLIRVCERRGVPISAVIVDADNLESINDSFGAHTGDDVLRQMAALLRVNVRPSDVVARMRDEEFVVLAPGATQHEALRLAWRLRDAVRCARWSHIIPDRTPTISVGVATLTLNAAAELDVKAAGDDLLGRAHSALNRAKDAGRDCVVAADAAAAAAAGEDFWR